jgi:hypothetical protein
LTDLLPLEKTIPLGGGNVTVTGVSLRKFMALIVRHPELLGLLNGKTDIAAFVAGAADTANDIVSLGLIEPDEDKVEAILKAFDAAPMGQQIDILDAIKELTLTGKNVAPFLEGVMRGYAKVTAAPSPTSSSPLSEPSNS